MADSSKPSWRRGSSGTAREASAAGKGWQNRRVKTSQTAVSSHRAKLVGLGVLVIALATYFAIKVFFIPVKTPLLIVSANGYPAPLSPNSYAQEDADLLTRTNTDNIQAIDLSKADLKRDEFLRQLDQLPKNGGGPNKNTVILYLSAHGALNDQAEPCLILTDSSPIDAATWLKFSEIVEKVKSRPNVNIVLLLDAGRLDDDWSLGVLYNGFAEQLEKSLTEAPVPNLHVLNAASVGERTWTAPEIGGSVFGFFASRGLSDAASKNDDIITLRELSSYLSARVSAWVAQNRASRQTPRLLTSLPPEGDLAVAYRGEPPADEEGAGVADQQRIDTDWKSVNESWLQLERAIQDRKLLRYEPLALAQMQRLLLRTEQLLLAGAAYRAEFESAQTQFRTLLVETNPRTRLPAELSVFTFPMQLQIEPTVSEESTRSGVLKKWIDAKGKPPIKEGDPPLPQLEYADASKVAWQFVGQLAPPTRGQLRDALALVDEARTRSKSVIIADPGEILFLRMVDRFVDLPAGNADFTDATQRYLQRSIATRDLAEQAAAPEDERVHYWLQPLVDAADVNRRLSEDALFCDGVAATEDAQLTKIFASRFQFRDQYTTAVQRGQQMAAAYALRDEVWAGLPFLADWLLRSEDSIRQNIVGGDGTLAVAADYLQQLADKNQKLAATLDEALTANQLDLPTLPAAVKELNAAWSKLRDPFIAHCQELKDRAGQNKLTLREISDAMRVPSPWLEAEERGRLATKYQSILFAEVDRSDTDSASPTSETTEESSSAPAFTALKKHPVLSLLARDHLPLVLKLRSQEPDNDSSEESPPAKFVTQGTRVRRWLSDLSQTITELEDVTNRRLEDSNETAANLRAGISEADRLTRATAAIAVTHFPDPAQRLRRVDLHLEFLWHAQRALDDFWGPPGDAAGSESYFAIVADAYLSGARRLENKHQSLVHNRVNLNQLLSERKAAIAGTRIEPQDVTTLGDSPNAEQQVHVEWHKDLPSSGVAALFLEGILKDSQSELIPVSDRDSRPWRRQALPLGKSPATDVVHLVPTQQLTTGRTEQELTASLLFRGNLLQRPFSVRGSIPLLVSVNPQLPRKAKVTVKGEGNRRAFIAFVFDCSDSMNEDGRLGKAVAGLTKVLDALRGDEHYHVGLFAYGHRARFRRPDNAFIGPTGEPTDVNPDRDVELLQPVEPLTDEHCVTLKRQLNELKAMGVTPLYHSIRFALQSNVFQLARPEDMKHIIVISDGIDYQFQERTTVGDVKQVLTDPRVSDIRVDVVMFASQDIQRDPQAQQIVKIRGSTVQQELEDITSLASQTQGKMFSAENPDELTLRLREALRLVEYSVTPAESPKTAPVRKDLDKEWPLLKLPPSPIEYVVRLHGVSNPAEQRVWIEGGEALELLYDRAQDYLVFAPYRRGDAREAIEGLVDPRTNEEYRVLPILPRKNLQRVEFEVAIQNRDRLKFTPRPPHVWAVIQPLTDSEEGSDFPTYHFFDAEFVPDTPVPVLRFVVPNWPDGAKKAGLQMWVKFEAPPLEINGAGVAEELKSVTIKEDIANVSFRADIKQIGEGGRGWRLTVWEDHDPGTDLFTARVQAKPAPDQLRHQFFVGIDRVKHEFDYVEKPAPTVIITSRERIMQSAVTFPRVIMAVKE